MRRNKIDKPTSLNTKEDAGLKIDAELDVGMEIEIEVDDRLEDSLELSLDASGAQIESSENLHVIDSEIDDILLFSQESGNFTKKDRSPDSESMEGPPLKLSKLDTANLESEADIANLLKIDTSEQKAMSNEIQTSVSSVVEKADKDVRDLLDLLKSWGVHQKIIALFEGTIFCRSKCL